MTTTIRDEVEKINIAFDVPLAPLSSYRTGGKADALATPHSLEQLRFLLTWACERGLPVTVLGEMTNVLIADEGVEGLTILTTSLDSYCLEDSLLRTQCGLSFDRAIDAAIQGSLRGLEPFGGLPGTVGGAVRGNAASHQTSVCEWIEWIDFLTLDGRMHRHHRNDGGFSLKHSPFMENNGIIYEIAFRLIPTSDPFALFQKKNQNKNERHAAGQYAWPCAGCYFLNPCGLSAGKLIDEAGLKGSSFGGAMVSTYHGNFIVNPQLKATSNDIYTLGTIIAKKIKQRYGISLQREVALIGRWPQTA